METPDSPDLSLSPEDTPNMLLQDAEWMGPLIQGVISWASISWWVALSLGLWGAMLGIGQFLGAYIFLGIAFSLCVLKLIHSAFLAEVKRPLPAAIGSFLLLAVAIGIGIWTHKMSIKATKDADRLNQLNQIPDLEKQVKAIPDLQKKVDQFKDQWQDAEQQSKIAQARLQTKLEDYGTLEKLANSMAQFAKATEGYTQKQFEVSRMEDTQLLSFTHSVISRIRDIGAKCEGKDRAISSRAGQFPSNFVSMSQEQRSQFFSRQSQQLIADLESNRAACSSEYRSQVQGDATYARRELIARLGPEEVKKLKGAQPRLGFGVSDMAIDGMFAGPDPIDESANYLEMLADELTVEKDLKEQ